MSGLRKGGGSDQVSAGDVQLSLKIREWNYQTLLPGMPYYGQHHPIDFSQVKEERTKTK